MQFSSFLVMLVVLAAIAAGLFYSYNEGWLDPIIEKIG